MSKMDAQDDQHCVELGSAEVQIFSEPKDHSIGDVNPRGLSGCRTGRLGL